MHKGWELTFLIRAFLFIGKTVDCQFSNFPQTQPLIFFLILKDLYSGCCLFVLLVICHIGDSSYVTLAFEDAHFILTVG